MAAGIEDSRSKFFGQRVQFTGIKIEFNEVAHLLAVILSYPCSLTWTRVSTIPLSGKAATISKAFTNN
jgi:hypothetical protein